MDSRRTGANPPLFGVGIYPSASGLDTAVQLAQFADEAGFDFVSVQDHPYNPEFLDTWTLLTTLGGMTERVGLLTNVSPVPLRPPAMLAKAASTLDTLTQGRMELGLGAGGFREVISGYGGPSREPGQAVDALEEAIMVMRLLWQDASTGKVSFDGQYYKLENASPGPPPAHPIRIWIGGNKPRMLRLTGRLADGLIISSPYVPPEKLAEVNARVDEGAKQAGRDPLEIRRGYNVVGVITTVGGMQARAARPGVIVGPADTWVDTLVSLYKESRMDMFSFGFGGGDTPTQSRIFIEDVVPRVRAAVAGFAGQ